MAVIRKPGGYYVEYLYPTGEHRFQEHNSYRDEAMVCVMVTSYVARVWLADGCAIQEEKIQDGLVVERILFLINPYLLHEEINPHAFS
jgi:hypothetical protein